MTITKTGIEGVLFGHDAWRELAMVVQFQPDDDAEDIRARFEAAARAAIEVAELLAQDRREKAATNIIQFPPPVVLRDASPTAV